MSESACALVVKISGMYPTITGTNTVYNIGDVINRIVIDTELAIYKLPKGIDLEIETVELLNKFEKVREIIYPFLYSKAATIIAKKVT